MRRSLALIMMLSLVFATLLWVADVSAKSAGGGFRSGNRATTRSEDGGPSSGFSSDQGSAPGDWAAPEPEPKRVPKPTTWYRSLRKIMLGGLIGSLFLGRKLGGIGFLEIMVISGLILLAFRGLSKYQAGPVGELAGGGGYSGGMGALGVADGATVAEPDPRVSLERGLSDIRQADRSFDPATFSATVDGIFRTVQAAWTARDMGGAAGVLTVEMREKLQRECDRLKASGHINRVESIRMTRAAITEARQELGWDWINVYIGATLIDYTTTEGGLKIVEGNPFDSVQFHEQWQFVRPGAAHPWRVSAIE